MTTDAYGLPERAGHLRRIRELEIENAEFRKDRERLKYVLAELNSLTPAVRVLLRQPRITEEKIDKAMQADFGEPSPVNSAAGNAQSAKEGAPANG